MPEESMTKSKPHTNTQTHTQYTTYTERKASLTKPKVLISDLVLLLSVGYRA